MQPELHNPWRIQLRAQHAERDWRLQTHRWIGKLHDVKCVEKLRAEFRAPAFRENEFLDSATSTLQLGRPRNWPPPPRVVSMPTIAGRKELKTASGFANRFNPVPPRAGSPLIPTWDAASPVTLEFTLFPKVSEVIKIAPPQAGASIAGEDITIDERSEEALASFG